MIVPEQVLVLIGIVTIFVLDMSDFDERAAVNKKFSSKGEPNWISPVYNDDSRRYIAEELVGRHIIDNEDYSPANKDEGYTLISLFSGSSLLDKEILDKYHSPDSPVNIKAIDMAPPDYAKELEEEYDSLEVIEGDAVKEIKNIDNADGVIAIDGFQELSDEELFGGQESDGLADGIVDALNAESYMVSNSTYGVLDLFEQFEEWSDKGYEDKGDEGFVRKDEDSGKYVQVDSATIEDVEVNGEKHDITTPMIQTPRPYEKHLSEFEERGLKEIESGEIEAHTGSVEEIARSINEDVHIPEDEAIEVLYQYGVMKKE